MSAAQRRDAPHAQTLLQRTAPYVSVTYLSRALCAVRAFINARWLGPELYGFWGSLTFLMSFCGYLHGGVQHAMAREVPMLRGRGQPAQAHATVQCASTFFTVVLLAAGAAFWVVAWRLPPETPPLKRWGWWAAGLVVLVESLQGFWQVVTRAEERFADLNTSLLLSSALSLLLTCWLVIAYRLAGLFVVALVTPSVGLWYLRRRAGQPWRFAWSWTQTRAMIRTGWPILAMVVVFDAPWWVDRLIVLSFVGETGFGYYAFGVLLAHLSFLFPEAISSVIEPRLYYDYARRQRVEDVREHLWVPLKILAVTMPLGLVGLDLVLPAVIHHWFPAYAQGLASMRLLLWGSIFMGLAVCAKPLIIALDQQRRVLPLYGLTIIVNVVVSIALARRGWGLAGIALGTVIAYAMCCTGLLRFVFRRLGWPPAEALARIGLLYAPVAILFGLGLAAPSLLARRMPALSPWWWSSLRVVVLLAYLIGVGLLLRRRREACAPLAGPMGSSVPSSVGSPA